MLIYGLSTGLYWVQYYQRSLCQFNLLKQVEVACGEKTNTESKQHQKNKFYFFSGWTFLWLSYWMSLVLSLHLSNASHQLKDPKHHNTSLPSMLPNHWAEPCSPPAGLFLRVLSRTRKKAKYWRIFSSSADKRKILQSHDIHYFSLNCFFVLYIFHFNFYWLDILKLESVGCLHSCYAVIFQCK